MGALLAAFLAEVGIVTWRDVTGKVPNHTVAGLPLPADYLAAVMLFGALGLVGGTSDGAKRTAGLFGWGVVIATALNAWNPQSPLSIGAKPTGSSTTTSTTKTPAKVG